MKKERKTRRNIESTIYQFINGDGGEHLPEFVYLCVCVCVPQQKINIERLMVMNVYISLMAFLKLNTNLRKLEEKCQKEFSNRNFVYK